ncbi:MULTISPECIES: DUF262 domain-containing protein [Mycobacteriaceae]|uniref:DUF262 domain-containing protein n=1 Tax=Mycobacterium sp. 852002-51961_SCH5331710 TaxID=1834105 RepID=UPI0009EF62D3|nr:MULTISPECIES: DUF262 domain-containing protein [Mycobacteriaceae]CRL72722.1 hypothetical protein CPGR_02437 [Mycolicibacterium malmesburyense]
MKLDKSDLQLETIVTRINNNELDLQPSFQRGEIWDSKRRQRLIDTILRGWYVPAIHVVVDTEENELVLDGQQRLTTIRDFFGDRIVVDGFIEPTDARVSALDGLTYSTLPEDVRKAVNRFPIQIITLRDYNPQEPNELFFRLNQAYNLTPSEKRNALHGPARDQVKDLVVKLTEDGLLQRETIGFANGRLAYDDIIARACVTLELGNMRTHINNNVVEKYYRGSEFTPETIDKVERAGRRLLEQITNCPEKRVRFNKGTLQTWILYCHWASVLSPIPLSLLSSFEQDRTKVRRGDLDPSSAEQSPLYEVLRIYDDRASYRVTDVSSVLARDLAIHLYSEDFLNTPGVKGSSDLLVTLHKAPRASVQNEFFEFIDSSDWGNPIIEEHHDQ